MEPLKINLPFHEHPLTPVKIESACKWCGLKFNGVSDGYQCDSCIYGLFHKTCANNKNIAHPSQTCGNILYHTLNLERGKRRCAGCREKIYDDLYFICNDCVLVPTRRKGSFGSSYFHFNCAKYPPSKVINVPQHHDHKLILEMVKSSFTCAACGKDCDGYSYKCYECNLKFHVNCEKYPAEVTHFSHFLHPLKLFKGEPPAYTDGKCRLCGEKLANSEVFYHCSACNFSLDLQCVFHPPKQNPHDLNIHDHQLTLMPKSISFTCTTCGLNGDRSPYVCLPCDFTIHNDCSGFPWVININRHDHRVSRTSLIGVVNSVCGICRKKMDWSCGGYSCKRCPSYVFHTKCATREDVWDGKEMKDEPEEEEDIQPFKIIDENTIQHVSHKEHNLRLDKSGIFIKDRICEACVYPIHHHSFYSCMSCSFILHESCANLPLWKRHVVSNERYRYKYWDYFFRCMACGLLSNGFKYDATRSILDVRCASVTEPFVHKSHPHPLFYTSPRGVCSVCKKEAHHVLRCVEDDCGYVMDYKCALLPYEVKHSVDHHFLSLCYGEENASGKYWCDICEKETDPKTWFYTSKDCELTLHTDCVLGDFRGLKPGIAEDEYVHHVRRDFKVLRNNSMFRPLCKQCKSRCIFPFFLETWNKNSIHNGYYCSESCFYS